VLLGGKGKKTISGAYDLPEDFEHWLAKFPTGTNVDNKAEGSIEYLYSIMAHQAGIDFPETKLVAGENNNAYFLIKRMLFNVMSGNRDDHTKNFFFLMDDEGIWHNSPAYDFTFNRGINGEHLMLVGKSRKILLRMILPY